MESNFSIIKMFLQASFLVQIIMFGLILSSILSWAIIFNRSRFISSRLKAFNNFQSLLNSGVELLTLYKQISAQKYKIGIESIFFKGISEFLYLSKSNSFKASLILREVKRTMGIVLMQENELLEKNLATLATIQSIAPYVGLFGTVCGIMSVFHQLGSTTAGQATLAVVAPGISEALIATAMGLLAAIPAGIFYNKLICKIDYLNLGYTRSIQELINIIGKRAYYRRDN
jgi:biopolymer transport protein TolQ